LFLERHGADLADLPASPRHYYPFAGGWLEHTLNVARHALLLADRYREHYPKRPELFDRDLVVAGAVLHEAGRLRELTPGDPPGLTPEGSLFGHLALGRDLVRDLAAEVPGFRPRSG
jgi:3'-5' exoribonuclease